MYNQLWEQIHTLPETYLFEKIKEWKQKNIKQFILAVQYPFEQYWLEKKTIIHLTAIYLYKNTNSIYSLHVGVSSENEKIQKKFQHLLSEESMIDYFQTLNIPFISLQDSLQLSPVFISKPWGQEIWYTGIEKRGISNIVTNNYTIPLPWFLSAFFSESAIKNLVLLKILDPFPKEVYGDLYFEMHEKKQEVYVVTHINSETWKDKIGKIRLGFNKTKIDSYSNIKEFKIKYLEAVKKYETVRRKIDQMYDTLRVQEGYPLNQTLPPEVFEKWNEKIPHDLLVEEKKLRQKMNDFTNMKSLKIGDVIKIPTHIPHSLQHGVRTIEFQTPVYERLILSFAQKVLTQDHWDTSQAIQKMKLENRDSDSLEIVFESSNLSVEKVVEFDLFIVYRIILQKKAIYNIEYQYPYYLMIGVTGNIKFGNREYKAEKAGIYINPNLQNVSIENVSETKSICLLAFPSKP